MKIGIDARLWGIEHAGLGRYVMELIQALTKIDKKNRYTIFLGKKYAKQLEFAANFKIKVANIKHYSFEEQWLLAEMFSKEKLDLLHVPHFNVPLFYKRPFVVTIHDLLWHDVRGLSVTTQNPIVYLIKYLGYRLVVKHALNNSKAILTPSNTIKMKLANEHGVANSKINVTYEAPSRHFFSRTEKQNILKKYRLTKPYLIYVGSAYPHKNIIRAIEAVKIVNDQGEKLTIAVAGARNVFLNRLSQEIIRKNATRVTRFLGFVPDDDLVSLYRNSEALIQPSLSEGFGLTGLEAMASGTVVIASEIEIFKEIYKNAAIFINPKSVDDIKDKIEKLIKNNKLRLQLKQKGRLIVQSLSWKQLARQTLQVYESAV